jgi:hypothetical protein
VAASSRAPAVILVPVAGRSALPAQADTRVLLDPGTQLSAANNLVTRFLNGVQVRWDFRDNVIRVVNTRFLRCPSARMDAYTVPKGAPHGPIGEPDDFVSAVVRRE